MAEGRLEVKVGSVSFVGEGSSIWLAQQLDKVLAKLPELAQVAQRISPDGSTEAKPGTTAQEKKHTKGVTLASFLKEKKATSNQSRKFLATATWLHDVEDKNRLTTGDVTKALNDHNQGRLGNAAQCLINNAKSGHVAKDGKKQFYVTDEGRAELGK